MEPPVVAIGALRRPMEDVTPGLTSTNPFAEEDEHDQSSYALVTSLLYKMKNTLSAPLSSAVAAASSSSSVTTAPPVDRRPSGPLSPMSAPQKQPPDRPNSLSVLASNVAPPLVSLTPVVSEVPTFHSEYDLPPSRSGAFSLDANDGMYGTAIPGFPIQDDARSIRTAGSFKRNNSVSKVIRRIRGEGLSRDYWMNDENCKECYDCKSAFSTWRRKHHCRICGQIFCSRCASNIIKGSRFGTEGMVRICNLCLKTLEEDTYNDDDDDDRRSVASNTTSPFPAHQHRQSLEAFPQSPFAASQIFSHTDEPFNLYSIAESRKHMPRSSEDGSRPLTPASEWDPQEFTPAPFRRGVDEEEKVADAMPNFITPATAPSTPAAAFSNSAFSLPVKPDESGKKKSSGLVRPPLIIQKHSFIQFPGSPPDNIESPIHDLRSRVDSYTTELESPTAPFLRSRVHSRLGIVELMGEAGWRTRRESTAYAQELNSISMFHIRIMLRQMLVKQGIPNLKEWEETLLKLALQVARDLSLTSRREGADMDVRHYVKIKKIPGGSPRDSEYVDGAVITKNVAHKQMPRQIRNPRIMFVAFPFDYHRVEGQFMAFDPLLAQEETYLRNLVSRVAALRPHLVLVEKSVSRLGLEYLLKANIAVARTVKPSAIQYVSRVTQGDILSSMDRLAVEPRLGHCSRVRVQTFEHSLIPGKRKTFMRFEGCSRDVGCTLVLRGGDLHTLKRIKSVASFLVFIVRNLKMETYLWKDFVVTMPPVTTEAVPASFSRPRTASAPSPTTLHGAGMAAFTAPHGLKWNGPFVDLSIPHQTSGSGDEDDDDLPHEDAAQLRLSRRIQHSVEPYYRTFISASSTLRFSPPYPIRRMKELDDRLHQSKRQWEDEIILREETGRRHHQEVTITQWNIDAMYPTSTIVSTPTTDMDRTPTFNGGDEPPNYFNRRVSTADSYASFISTAESTVASLASSADDTALPGSLKHPSDIALESALSKVRFEHDEQRPIWEWYLRKNNDDFVVEQYQKITVRTYTAPIVDLDNQRPCFMPVLQYMTYYGENDHSLGQFIEESCIERIKIKPDLQCNGKSCEVPVLGHCNVYLHNETRLFVATEPWTGKIGIKGAPADDFLTTWSVCRLCGQFTPFIPVSEETQRYSFAKFLELHFYPADVSLFPGAGCLHNIYKHHIRYFAWKGMTVRFQADPVTLYETVFPPMRIRIDPGMRLEFKNLEYEHALVRNANYWVSVVKKLRALHSDDPNGEKSEHLTASACAEMLAKAEGDKLEITRAIHKAYKDTSPTDTNAFGAVRRALQTKVSAWDREFDVLEESLKPSSMGFVDRSSVVIPGRIKQMFGGTIDRPRHLNDDIPGASASDVEKTSLRQFAESVPLPASEAESGSATESTDTDPPGSEAENDADDVTPNPSAPPTEGIRTREATPDAGSSTDPVTKSPKVDKEDQSKSDAESDCTISAVPITTLSLFSDDDDLALSNNQSDRDTGSFVLHPSRLPRRSRPTPRVADLVKQFQRFSTSQDGESTTTSPLTSPRRLLSESEQEGDSQPRRRIRGKPRPKSTYTSDFERSYAANVAPKHFAHAVRRTSHASSTHAPVATRIPAASRGVSPSRPFHKRVGSRGSIGGGVVHFEASRRPSSPGKESRAPSLMAPTRSSKGKAIARPPRERSVPRPIVTSGPKAAARRGGFGHGTTKVSNLARQYERLAKDTERSNRRYAIIRGRRARPVASGRVKVEVFETFTEGLKAHSDSSSSSSEADDEDEGDEDFGSSPYGLQHTTDHESGGPPARIASLEQVLQDSAKSGGHVTATFPPATQPSIILPVEDDLDDGPLAPIVSGSPVDLTILPSDLSIPPSPILPAHSLERITRLSPEHEYTGPERPSSILKAFDLFQQWTQPKRMSSINLEYPAPPSEHFFTESNIVIREDEPTSIIAFTLDSQEYRKGLAIALQAQQTKLAEKSEAFMPDDSSVGESKSTWGLVSIDDIPNDPGDQLKQAGETVRKFTYDTGTAIITCRIYFQEAFDALRKACGDCERDMIESLSRCFKWDASGGKSGSGFLKSRDDRFIAKELSLAEFQTMSSFGPKYFDYMAASITAGRPTLLAKVFGFYQLTFKQKDAKDVKDGAEPSARRERDRTAKRTKTTTMNLLVMENLFYDRKFSKVYDLKGSTRNRRVSSTGREHEVLLDENLVEIAHLIPFYLREHSKRILRGAVWNDSKFLADLNIMDYSLLVGVDTERNELVLGIVDYIRTYTWDKRLESWVKESAFLGGGRGEPTIITPKQYKHRFRSALERYFPLVPDRWMKLKDSPDDEGNSLLDLWPDW